MQHNRYRICNCPEPKVFLPLFRFLQNLEAYFLLLEAPYRLCTSELRVLFYSPQTSFLQVCNLQLMHGLLVCALLVRLRIRNKNFLTLQMKLSSTSLLALQSSLYRLSFQNLLLLPFLLVYIKIFL